MKKLFFKGCIILSLLSIATKNYSQTHEWTHSADGEKNSVEIDLSGNIYSLGTVGWDTDFDPGPGVYELPSYDNNYIQKLDIAGNLVWVKPVPGSSLYGNVDHRTDAIALDPSGNIYVTGFFDGTDDFDPGSGVLNISSAGDDDAFVLKLDPDGNLLWAKTFGGVDEGQGRDIRVDNLGNVYLLGTFYGTVDFEPGTAGATISGSPGQNVFVLKLNAMGDFTWVKSFNETGFGVGGIAIDDNGDVYIANRYGSSNADFDPGVGVHQIPGVDFDIVVVKLLGNGDFVWARAFLSSGYNWVNDINVDPLGNVYTSGRYGSNTDFDPGPGSYNLTGQGIYNTYVHKMDTDGNFLWVSTVEGTDKNMPTASVIDPAGSIYTTGYLKGTADFDPGAGIQDLVSQGDQDIFVQKLDFDGNLVWAHSLGSADYDWGSGIALSPSGLLYIAGHFNDLVDFDPSPGVAEISGVEPFYANGFLTCWDQGLCGNLSLSIDAVENITEFLPGSATGLLVNGTPPYSYSWNTSPVINTAIADFSDRGRYMLTANDANGCSRRREVFVDGPKYLNWPDINPNLISGNLFRPGGQRRLDLTLMNDGLEEVNGELFLVLDSLVEYDGGGNPDRVNGDTLFWDFSNFNYWDGPIEMSVYVVVSTEANIGDQICFELNAPMKYWPDYDRSNNQKFYCFEVVNSCDPNDIKVSPTGACGSDSVELDQMLTYTIRFQNTGTAPAIDIYILDSLSLELDMNTVNVIAQSHPGLITESLPGNVLKFRYDGINLPDSLNNEPESSGYIVFEVEPLEYRSSGTVVENWVGIYFDYNDPVITNTVRNTLVSQVPDCSEPEEEPEEPEEEPENPIGGVGITEISSGMYLSAFPNPFKEELNISLDSDHGVMDFTVELLDLSGRSIYRKEQFKNGDHLNTGELQKGTYLLKIETQKGMGYLILIKE